MATEIAGEMNCNSETEEETIAVQKKRSRRVSFAENTSVHIFDRDDEFETPQEPKPSSSAVNATELRHFNDELGFRRNSSDAKEFFQNDEEEDEEEDDDIDARGPFLRPLESPSSGSGFGSATSNDGKSFSAHIYIYIILYVLKLKIEILKYKMDMNSFVFWKQQIWSLKFLY